MTAATQFQVENREITNLDRCTLCGTTRAAHGIDWTCSPGPAALRTDVIAAIAIAGLLAIAGVVVLTVTSATSTSLGTIGAAIGLGGLTVLACAAEISYRRRAHPGR